MHSDSKNYRDTRDLALKEYKKIGKIRCPALNDELVYFSNAGFRHLIRKDKIRSRAEQKQRFLLLPFAKEIIGDSNSTLEYREKILNGSLTQYWSLTNVRDNLPIRVVIRQVNNGRKHFYSIIKMD